MVGQSTVLETREHVEHSAAEERPLCPPKLPWQHCPQQRDRQGSRCAVHSQPAQPGCRRAAVTQGLPQAKVVLPYLFNRPRRIFYQ